MSFTQEFIEIALLSHSKWVEKISYCIKNFDIPISWKPQLLTIDSELVSFLGHMKIEIFEKEMSAYSELRYEYEYTKELIHKLYIYAQVIHLLIDILKKKPLSAESIDHLKETIDLVAVEIFDSSNDIINRLLRWKELESNK